MPPRTLGSVTARRYWFAWGYLCCFVLIEACYALLSPGAQRTFLAWVTTSVANLGHDPLLCLVCSAFVITGGAWAWPALIAAAVFPACRVAGSGRTLGACVAGHVVGTLVSEAIVAWRVHAGSLPLSDTHLIDVGPSYVVVAALVVALLSGWPSRFPAVRAVAAADLAILVFAGDIFAGLSGLDVAAVGHLAAIVTAVVWVAASGYVAHRKADQVGDPGRARTEQELADGAPPERPSG
jgi:hypothetical protein